MPISNSEIRSAWDGKSRERTLASAITCKDKTLARQSEKEACDINTILAKYEKTGILPDMIRENPVYGDFSDVPSFQEALAVVSLANEQFEALDAKVRLRFNNDPASFLAFASNPANLDEMTKLGLAKAVPAPEAVSVAPDAKSEAVKA